MEKNKNLPIATEILKDYKKINKRLYVIVVILSAILFIETAFIIFSASCR